MILIFSLMISMASAQTSQRAYELAREKKWPEALSEATSATVSNPNDGKAWFMLGLVQERTEKLSESLESYNKYLALNPDPKVAEAVQTRLADIRPRANLQNQDRYGKSSNGFFFEKQLSYAPKFVAEVNGKLTTPFSFGFNFGLGSVGYRRATGSYTENIKAPASHQTSPTYNIIAGGGDIIHQELFANFNISLVDPYTTMGDLQLALPLTFGGFMNTLKSNLDGTMYGNVGYDLGIGLAIKGYSRSAFTWYAHGIYHLSIPFWGIRESGYDLGIKNAQNDDVKGSASNFEVAVGINILFGEDLKKHY